MVEKLYEIFVEYFLNDDKYKNTSRAFSKEVTKDNSNEQKKADSGPKPTKEIEGYEMLKSLSGGGKLLTGDLPEHYLSTFTQLKTFIEQSLEEFKVCVKM